jgi:3-deoxy-D-manno-octulosonate 8-phosphate phosphatase (KDO 8-P phosphatase)
MNEIIRQKAEKIKAFIFDVDGVLTDGGIIYDGAYNELKRFNAKDGLIIKALMQHGFVVGAITGRKSEAVARRLTELNLDFQYHGAQNKNIHYKAIKEKYQLADEQIAYIGDDLNDLVILTQCGLSATPADAMSYMHNKVDFSCQRKGGTGAVREFADFILETQGKLQTIIDSFCQY